MNPNLATLQADLLAHYVYLAAQPGWKAYVWDRVQQLARECPELYSGLPAALTSAVKSAAPPADSPPPSSSKPANPPVPRLRAPSRS